MRYLIRTRRGRAHLAYRSGPQWVGICGSLITHITERGRAVSAAELPAIAGVCFYCLAIGSEASMIERRAAEAVLDAGSVLPLRVGA